MKRPKIIAEASIPYLRGVVEELGEVTYLPSSAYTPEAVQDADWLIVRSITKCDRTLLEGSHVQLITSATIGFDHIDTAYCAAAGIIWHNAPGCNAEAVGQYFGATLAHLYRQGSFDPRGKTIGIVGVGHVGKVVARYAKALGMQLLLNDPPRAEREGEAGFATLQEIAERADLITFHTPLTKEGKYPTLHLCDRSFIQSLQKRPILINACRGAVTETQALLEGLEEGLISATVIDCWENEPTIHPLMLQKSALATPHIAGFSADGKSNGTIACIRQGLQHFGLHSSRLHLVTPPPPQAPLIDLRHLHGYDVVIEALLRTLDLQAVDSTLRKSPDTFEALRRHYPYPREPHAYQLLLNPHEPYRSALRTIGFEIHS